MKNISLDCEPRVWYYSSSTFTTEFGMSKAIVIVSQPTINATWNSEADLPYNPNKGLPTTGTVVEVVLPKHAMVRTTAGALRPATTGPFRTVRWNGQEFVANVAALKAVGVNAPVSLLRRK